MKAKYFCCVVAILFCVGFYSTAAFSQEESITFTTYYPAPYGVYNKALTGSLGVGDNNSSGGLDSGDVPATSGDAWIKGKVGIGTTNPQSRLHISGSGGDQIIRVENTDVRAPGIEMRTPSYLYSMQLNGTTGTVYLTQGSTSTFSVMQSGNVGIGTNTPAFILDVSHATSKVNSKNGYLTNGADYAEYFENEEVIPQGSLVGINMATGKTRKYRQGDEFLGIASNGKGFIGNGDKTIENSPDYTVVGLLGQLNFNQDEVAIEGRIVYTKDRKKIGILLANGKVLVR
jgi:hypothetical protein